jgi:hypothetical protein
MPWKCPACQTLIRPQLIAAGEDKPTPGKIYRCTVCRLELVLDPETDALTVTPLRDTKAQGSGRAPLSHPDASEQLEARDTRIRQRMERARCRLDDAGEYMREVEHRMREVTRLKAAGPPKAGKRSRKRR